MAFQIYLVSGLFAAMGLYALAFPHKIVDRFGVVVETGDGRNEIRAVYGGFGVAIGALLLAPLIKPALLEGVVLAVAVALLGMAAGRVVGAVFDRPGLWPVVFFGIELAGAALLLSA